MWDRVLNGSPFPGLAAFEANRGSGVLRPRPRDSASDRAAARGRVRRQASCLSCSSSAPAARASPRCCAPASCRGLFCPVRFRRSTSGARDRHAGPDPFCVARGRPVRRRRRSGRSCGKARSAVGTARQAIGGDPDTSRSRRCARRMAKAAERRGSEAHFEAPRPARLVLAIDQAERLFVGGRGPGDGISPSSGRADARKTLAYVDHGSAQRRLCAVPVRRGAGRVARGGRDVRPRAAVGRRTRGDRQAAGRGLRIRRSPSRHARAIRSQRVLVAEAKGGDALPLLQMTLSRLYAAKMRGAATACCASPIIAAWTRR